jgi:TonB family protein
MKKEIVLFVLLALILNPNAQAQVGCTGCIQGDGKPHPTAIEEYFPGGKNAFHQFIKDSLSLKSDYIFNDDDYVGLFITINRYGYLTNIKILEPSSCEECDKAAVRFIKKVRKWIPACAATREKCKYIPVSFSVLVPFGKSAWIFMD